MLKEIEQGGYCQRPYASLEIVDIEVDIGAQHRGGFIAHIGHQLRIFPDKPAAIDIALWVDGRNGIFEMFNLRRLIIYLVEIAGIRDEVIAVRLGIGRFGFRFAIHIVQLDLKALGQG